MARCSASLPFATRRSPTGSRINRPYHAAIVGWAEKTPGLEDRGCKGGSWPATDTCAPLPPSPQDVSLRLRVGLLRFGAAPQGLTILSASKGCHQAPMVGAGNERRTTMSKPAHTLRDGSLSVVIWRNTSTEGRTYYSLTPLTRPRGHPKSDPNGGARAVRR